MPRDGERWVAILSAAITAVATGSMLVVTSGPDMLIGLLPVAALACWVVAVVFAGVKRRRTLLLAALAVPVLAVLVGTAGVPGSVRFKLSEGGIASAGREVLAGAQPDRAGLYGLKRAFVHGECAVMTTQGFAIEEWGWAYCPDGRDPDGEGSFFTRRTSTIYAYTTED
jgi:hypothetical protein